MNKKFANRLLKLADFLDELPRKKFDYGEYAEKRECGTVGCALGWACMMPAFRRLGARLEHVGNQFMIPVLKDAPGSQAEDVGQELFGVSDEEFRFLFFPSWCGLAQGRRATPKQVAKHIRKFVAERV